MPKKSLIAVSFNYFTLCHLPNLFNSLIFPALPDPVEGGDEVHELPPGALELLQLSALHAPDHQLRQGRGAGKRAQIRAGALHTLEHRQSDIVVVAAAAVVVVIVVVDNDDAIIIIIAYYTVVVNTVL